jgi:hypothetical protein
VPFKYPRRLSQWLYKHKQEFPIVRMRKYRGHKTRMLSQTEILRAREILMRPYSYGSGRPPAHPIARMLRAAAALPKADTEKGPDNEQ